MIKLNEKKAQVWGMDLMFSIIIFVLAIFITIMYFINSYSNNTIGEIDYYAELISNKIISEGFPVNWNPSNVAIPGIMSNNKINNTKLEYFYYLSLNDYNRVKSLLGTRYNFYLNFSEPVIINGTSITEIGRNSNDSQNLVRITRFVAYTNNPITINFYIWN